MLDKYNIKQIRLLPMSTDEFPTYDEVKEFLDHQLPIERNGRYWHQKHGINLTNTDTIILFQYNASIVGYGVFYTREKFTSPKVRDGIMYYGINYFYPGTIKSIPSLNAFKFRSLIPSFKNFSQSMQIIELKYYDRIIKQLTQ